MKKATPNFYHKGTEYTRMDGEAWKDIWAQDKASWHRENVHGSFVKYGEQMLDGRENITVFFPLCGRAIEMKLLYDLGHQVVGVDLASQPLEGFFKEHNIEFTSHDLVKKGKLYKSLDGRLRLYAMDLYEFGPDLEKNMDAVWDRASLEAVNLEERSKYVSTILALLGDAFRYLVVCHEYDHTEYTGPPHPFTKSDVESLFIGGNSRPLTVTLLESEEQSAEKQKEFGTSHLAQCVYLIQPKS